MSKSYSSYPSSINEANELVLSNNTNSNRRQPYRSLQAPVMPSPPQQQKQRKQPNRTTKISQKLKLFPEDLGVKESFDANSSQGSYTQLSQDPRDRVELENGALARVTAYCTASSYQMEALIQLLRSQKDTNGAAPTRFDECLYTPYALCYPSSPPGLLLSETSTSKRNHQQSKSIRKKKNILPEMFLFDYGVVVFWGMRLEDEQRILKDLEAFEDGKLEPAEVEVDEFQSGYNKNCRPRIYNDIIVLRNPSNYMVKLTIAHAIAQSVKMMMFERRVDDTIKETNYIPKVMSDSGKIRLSRTDIIKKIGQLFITRSNVNLVSNILDTPDIFWSEPALEPLYIAIRGYLEISQRVELLNKRVQVINDLLQMLKNHLNSLHGEQLEWIIIWLIAMEIVVALVTICLDASSLSNG